MFEAAVLQNLGFYLPPERGYLDFGSLQTLVDGTYKLLQDSLASLIVSGRVVSTDGPQPGRLQYSEVVRGIEGPSSHDTLVVGLLKAFKLLDYHTRCMQKRPGPFFNHCLDHHSFLHNLVFILLIKKFKK